MILAGLTKRRYQTDVTPFDRGGEGDIYDVIGQKDKVIKIYHADKITSELEEKLKVMVKRPPNASILSQVAWPLDLVYDSYGHFLGFVMPKIHMNAELRDIYVYPPLSNITYRHKLILA